MKKKSIVLSKKVPTRNEYIESVDACIKHVANATDLFEKVNDMGRQLGYTTIQIGQDFKKRAKALGKSDRTIQRFLPSEYKYLPRGVTTPENIFLKAKQKQEEISANLAQNQEQKVKEVIPLPQQSQPEADKLVPKENGFKQRHTFMEQEEEQPEPSLSISLVSEAKDFRLSDIDKYDIISLRIIVTHLYELNKNLENQIALYESSTSKSKSKPRKKKPLTKEEKRHLAEKQKMQGILTDMATSVSS